MRVGFQVLYWVGAALLLVGLEVGLVDKHWGWGLAAAGVGFALMGWALLSPGRPK